MPEKNCQISSLQRQENIELLRKELERQDQQENHKLKSLWQQKNALILHQENAIKRQYNLLLPFISLTIELGMFLTLIWFAPLKELLIEPILKYLTIGAGALFLADEVLNVKTFIQNLAKRDKAMNNIANSPEVIALDQAIKRENEQLLNNTTSRVLVQQEIMDLNKEISRACEETEYRENCPGPKLIRKRH